MGMAASQARYLALTARKTNTEWEGQQINQARTALANQSANLFNRLLNMEVPNAPKTSDYTKLQYSYSDGDNDSVFESWHQINSPNPNYNYVVSHYYMADIFTGIQRLLQNPEVQLGSVLNQMQYNTKTTEVTKNEDDNIVVNYKINDYDHYQTYNKITSAQVEGDDELKTAITDYAKYADRIKPDGSIFLDGIYGYKDDDSVWHFFAADEYTKIHEDDATGKQVREFKKALELYEYDNNLITSDGEYTFDGIYKTKDADGNWVFVNQNDYTQIKPSDVADVSAKELRDSLYKYEDDNNLLNKYDTLNYNDIYGYKDDSNVWHFQNTVGYKAVNYEDVLSNEALKTALTQYETDNNLLLDDGSLRYNQVFLKENGDGTWTFTNTVGYSQLIKEQIDSDEELKTALTTYETQEDIMVHHADLTFDRIYGKQDADGNWSFVQLNDNYTPVTQSQIDSDQSLKDAFTKYEIANDLMVKDPGLTFDKIYGYKDVNGNYQFINTDDYTTLNKQVVDADDALKTALTTYEVDNHLLDPDGNLTYDGIYGYKDADNNWQFINVNDTNKYTQANAQNIDYSKNDDLLEALTKFETEHGMLNDDGSLNYEGVYGYQDSLEAWHFYVDKFRKDEKFMLAKDNIDYYTTFGPSYVGNSKLTELNQLVVDKNVGIDQVTDLAQILKDCPDSAVKNYVSLDDYGNLQYAGKGIYTFELLGNTYYTTYEDLITSHNNAKNKNTIDDQSKLAYYTASYVPTKIEQTNQALIQKDSSGRFQSVKFDNDSSVYNLNVEEVLNESAYNDAMNNYLNQKAQYEKTIADINAKTSIIQKEDRTLELRLKQLDTEQNALATEMDAVKKVIKDNVEKTFKTFSD